MKQHHYTLDLKWEGNRGEGTAGYKSYGREYRITGTGKDMTIQASADSSFLGNAALYNPEEFLLASIASCHMLWYLHLCSDAKITVLDYKDRPVGLMVENADGSGQFESVTLQPHISLAKGANMELAEALHAKAHAMCFIARSCNFKINHRATYSVQHP